MKFIRKNGRVIPIRDKSAAAPSGDRKQRAALVNKWADSQKSLISAGRKVGAVFGVAAAGLGALAFKKKSAGAAIGAAAAGLFSMTNYGFASGREMGARDARGYAKDIAAGRKLKRGSGIGNASEIAYNTAKYTQKMGKKELSYFSKKFGNKKGNTSA